jgi:serine phosphatase RsbU (regulator of sigma subunit)
MVDPGGGLRVVAAVPEGTGTAPGDRVSRAARAGEVVADARTVTAPLNTPAGTIGALTLGMGVSGRRFAGEDVDLVRSLAARAALHVHNARLYQERSHIALTLQASLRPRALPAIPGAEVAARFLPAGDQNAVGGDFYDVFDGPDGTWTAIVGDVSGKGAEAAALTSLARHTLRAAAMVADDPGANLALLNRAMYADSAPGDFCTVLYAHLRPAGDGFDVRLSNGGHPPPLLLRAGGRVEHLEGGRGPVVGAIPEAVFGHAQVRLDPGDLLLLYTDGVTEVRPSDVAFGEHELEATLAAHAGDPADAVVQAVARRAVEIQPGEPRDDIALLAIRAVARDPR